MGATRRVVVTGLGLESCLGSDLDDFWRRVVAGRSGIRPVTAFETDRRTPCRIAGQVEFDPREFMTATDVRRTSRYQQLLFASARRALGDEKPSWQADPYRAALVVGTGGGALPFAEAYAERERRAGPDRLTLIRTLPNMGAGFLAQRVGIRGPVLTVSTACASSTDAIGLAFHLVRSGTVDVGLASGVEAWITHQSIRQFCAMQVLSTRPPAEAAQASRPFDRDRDGMVPAEAAGTLVLETLEHAVDRGAEPLAEVLGAASTCDAHHPSAPMQDGAAAAAAVTTALADARVAPEEVDVVNAHGTSTRLNDVVETRALKAALGRRAYGVAVTAPKSMVGHASGACGVVECAVAVLSLRAGMVTPTINLDNPDPECDLDYVADGARPLPGPTTLAVNFGFGGQNSAVVFRATRGRL